MPTEKRTYDLIREHLLFRYLHTVTGKGYAGADALRVGIPAGESVTVANVYVGETYTVSEEGAWSWRFTAQECGSGGLSAGVNVCSVPAAQPVRTLWLSGCDADRKSKPALTIAAVLTNCAEIVCERLTFRKV